jgi:hypothetical protein
MLVFRYWRRELVGALAALAIFVATFALTWAIDRATDGFLTEAPLRRPF